MGHKYTDRQLEWLKENRIQHEMPALTDAFNLTFNTKLSRIALKGTCRRMGFKSGRTGCFKKGNVPFNKGNKGISVSPGTEFSKGHTPHNILPVGTELLKDDGYLWVKTQQPNVWRQKHRLIWESKHGPQPPGTSIIFLDGDTKNIEPDNLKMVTRHELLQLNRNKYRQMPKELKPSVLALSKLEVAIFKQID